MDFHKKKTFIIFTCLFLISTPIVEALYIKNVNMNGTVTTSSSSYFKYNFLSTSTLRPNDGSNTVSTGINQTLNINYGVIYKVGNSLLVNHINDVIKIESKSSPEMLKLSIVDGTSPLGLVGLSDILLLPTSTYSFSYGTSHSIDMTIQLGVLFTVFGQFTGGLEVRSIATGNVLTVVPISMFVTLL